VEGAERMVLDGAREIFTNPIMRPRLVLLEMYDKHFELYKTSISDLIVMMKEYGYKGFCFDQGIKVEFRPEHYNKNCNVFFELN
jgi:hypothetical protein